MSFKAFLSVLVLVFVAGPAFGQAGAVNDFTDCSGNTPSWLSKRVGEGQILCYEFDESQGSVATTSFEILAASGSVCLNRDTATSGGTGSIIVQWCVAGSTASDTTCATIDTISTDACQSYSRGIYRLDVTATGAGEDAKVEIRGY